MNYIPICSIRHSTYVRISLCAMVVLCELLCARVHVQEEMEKQQAYFEHLEKKEAMEQMMQSVTEKRVTVFQCAKVRTSTQ